MSAIPGALSAFLERLELVELPSLRRDVELVRARWDRELRRYADVYPELRRIEPLLDRLLAELEQHLKLEEQVIFPEIRMLERRGRSVGALQSPLLTLTWSNAHLSALQKAICRHLIPGSRPSSLESAFRYLGCFLERLQGYLEIEISVLVAEAARLERETPRVRPASPDLI
ncbi:MAG: hemerythrin domain-containing protein [Armatimonadetes bacterium]|nr:hemerythrin domain-containing protein [Armatimonadota bacterium]